LIKCRPAAFIPPEELQRKTTYSSAFDAGGKEDSIVISPLPSMLDKLQSFPNLLARTC
jgi:hypothetical protein